MAATAAIAAREKQLKKLRNFVDKTGKQLDSILGSLKWTKERILEKKGYVICPFDPGHKMPASSLDKHLELCSWLKEGYTRAEKVRERRLRSCSLFSVLPLICCCIQEEAPPSSHFFYANSTSVVPVLIGMRADLGRVPAVFSLLRNTFFKPSFLSNADRETQQKVITEAAFRGEVAAEACQKVKNVPLTMARCIVELSPAERFAIYDYTVARAKAANKTPSIKLADLQINFEKKDNDQEHPPSELEIKSKMRDYKRRRQSYRAKNVHITRKSYTEVLREVIENQADYLRHMLKEDDESIAVSERPTRVSGSSRTESQAPPSSVREAREASVASSKRRRSLTPEPRKTAREKTHHASDTSSRHRSSNGHEHRKHRHHHHKGKHKHKHKSKRSPGSED
ncbi:U11/U12 small nuclear ribonucleoprotein 48 kDa protein isoform X1 [Ixodes scapularis]|uniref:U11/U12 small nuclear ribonucleoprotein 48 kDa protein isoform X1 n=1 Tax=Ixodes scapularis TaxID=6945 RepID=UPI001C38E1B1|nr:U11/U12 small nuclear ribonucleoprotein 48 kDa protein isoform X1 [Ixodes scapularis]